MDFYGYLSLLVGVAMAALGYEYGLYLLIPLGVIFLILGVVLVIKDKIDARREKKAKQEALLATAIHREGDEEFNRRAKSIKRRFYLCFVGMGATVVLIMVLTSYDMINGYVLIGAAAAIFGLFMLAGRMNKKLGALQDGSILQKVLEARFESVEILPYNIHADLVRSFNSGLPHFDKMNSYNLIKLTQNGLTFFVGDINLEYLRTNTFNEPEESVYMPVFRGQFFYCDLCRTFPASLRLWSEYAPVDGVFKVSFSGGTASRNSGAKRVLRMESSAPIGIAEILSPYAQKRLREFAEATAHKVYISIEQSGQMCLALDTGADFFSAKSWDAAVMRRQFTDNASIVADIADVLCAISMQ